MNITIDDQTRAILKRLAQSWGLSESATIRYLVRLEGARSRLNREITE